MFCMVPILGRNRLSSSASQSPCRQVGAQQRMDLHFQLLSHRAAGRRTRENHALHDPSLPRASFHLRGATLLFGGFRRPLLCFEI